MTSASKLAKAVKRLEAGPFARNTNVRMVLDALKEAQARADKLLRESQDNWLAFVKADAKRVAKPLIKWVDGKASVVVPQRMELEVKPYGYDAHKCWDAWVNDKHVTGNGRKTEALVKAAAEKALEGLVSK